MVCVIKRVTTAQNSDRSNPVVTRCHKITIPFGFYGFFLSVITLPVNGAH